ncbi:hypothetical protein DIC66_21590 [Rhodoferax lacus]|uniref:Cytochrome c domain-containing protein n=1 Tax=Rhodoferax lacus TaxID=2184758 RepID=A0A3E1R5Z4_9BURK|nr:cytochrome c [Rhodoferax lacus]RFO94808.1 hypothetical protein DIC66_21590 [Rhodoferax lacus]
MAQINPYGMLLAIGIAAYSSCTLAQVQAKEDIGQEEFESHCASCHGKDGKGGGPLVDFLKRRSPDLTVLAKANHGVLPMKRLFDVIEGEDVPIHGSREMPVWGREFRIQNAANLREARGLYDSESLVRARILMLLEYLDRLQVR